MRCKYAAKSGTSFKHVYKTKAKAKRGCKRLRAEGRRCRVVKICTRRF